jgi:hypothetical protein
LPHEWSADSEPADAPPGRAGADSVLPSLRSPEGTHFSVPAHFREEKPQSTVSVARPGRRRADGGLCHEDDCAEGALESGGLTPPSPLGLYALGTLGRRSATADRTPRRFAHFHAPWWAQGSWNLRSELVTFLGFGPFSGT